MNNRDSKIKLEELVNLQMDINDELDRVKRTLEQVEKAAATAPGEDDYFMKTVESVSNNLASDWNKLTTVFKNVSESMQNTIQGMLKMVQDQVEKTNNMKKGL